MTKTATRSKSAATTSRRIVTQSQSRGRENRQFGIPDQIGLQSPPVGNESQIRKDHMTDKSSHGPIRGHELHDPSEEPVTRTRSYAQLPISAFFGTENRVPGTLPARRKSGTEAIKSFLDGTKSQDSFDPNQEYQEDVTYG